MIEASVIPAYAGLKAVFKSYNADPDLVYDVVAWYSDPTTSVENPVVEGLVIEPDTNVSPFLIRVSQVVVDGYLFAGYSYCPPGG